MIDIGPKFISAIFCPVPIGHKGRKLGHKVKS